MSDSEVLSSVDSSVFTPWWGAYTLPEHCTHHWKIGALTSWLMRTDREWRIAWEAGRDPLAHDNIHEGPLDIETADFNWEEPTSGFAITRYSMKTTHEGLHLQPVLADRSVVIRPEHPISIVSGESITLFVSTPLWVRLEVHDPARQLIEMPTMRPSDTWFGTNTREGELCYASRTTGRLHLSEVPRRPHRAITPLRIRNKAEDTLLLERVQVPTPYLALYEAEHNALWTQAITLERAAERLGSDPAAAVHIRPGAPPEAKGAPLLTEPRERTKRNLFVSTFSAVGSIFGA